MNVNIPEEEYEELKDKADALDEMAQFMRDYFETLNAMSPPEEMTMRMEQEAYMRAVSAAKGFWLRLLMNAGKS